MDRSSFESSFDIYILTLSSCNFLVLPKITDHSNATIDVEEGDDVRLFCKATGDPKPYIEWKNDGVLLQKTNQTTSHLLMKRIDLKNSGNYVCTAVNLAGSASFNVLVRVKCE